MATALRSNRGQSLVETVVFLPVLLMLIIGLDYLYTLTAARGEAIEVTRFASWESAWHLRDDGNGVDSISAPPANLNQRVQQDIRFDHYDRFLLSSNANARSRTVDAYFNRVTEDNFNVAPPASGVADIVVPLFAGAAGQALAGAFGGAAGGLDSLVTPVLGGAGTVGAIAQDLMARQTGWVGEGDRSFYTARVNYQMFGAGFFRLMPRTNIVQFSSVLSHPLLIVRSNDQEEYDQLVGTNGLGDCAPGSPNKGHIFDLWLFPSGPFGGGQLAGALGGILGTGKCAFSTIASFLSAVDAITGTQVGFRMPEGTLKEFPERRPPLLN